MRPTLLLLTLAVLLGALLVPAVAGDEEGLERRAFDVSTLVTPRPDTVAPHIGSMAPLRWMPSEVELPPASPFLTPDMLLKLIRGSVAPESWDTVRDASIDVVGGWLRVANSTAAVGQVEAFLRELSEASGRRVLVTLRASEGKAQAFPPRAPGTMVRESGAFEAPPGVARSLQVEERISFVADYDPEIAQGSTILDPLVYDGVAGLAASVRPHVLSDGKTLVLDAIVHRGQYAEGREHELGVDEEYFPAPFRSTFRNKQGIVELPRFEHAGARLTAVLSSGGSVTIPVMSGGRVTHLTLTAELLGGAQAPQVLETSALTATPLPLCFDHLPARGVDSEYWRLLAPSVQVLDGVVPMLDADVLQEMVQVAVQPRVWEEKEVWIGSRAAAGAVLYGADAGLVAADVRAFLGAEERRRIRPLLLDLRVYESGAAAPSGPEVAFDEAQGTLVRAARVPVLSGWPASVIDGVTDNYLADYGTEVAQEARVADPIVGQTFGGLVLNALPRLTLDGRHADLDLRLTVSALEIKEEPFDPGAQTLGPVDRVHKRRATVATTLRVPVGGRYVLDAGPSPYTAGRRLAVVVRITRP